MYVWRHPLALSVCLLRTSSPEQPLALVQLSTVTDLTANMVTSDGVITAIPYAWSNGRLVLDKTLPPFYTPYLYEGEMTPYELVVALCRRASILQKLRRTELVITKALGKRLPAIAVMEFLTPKPLVLARGHLRRLGVPPGQVFLSLRRWCWEFGPVAVPRSLRKIVSVDSRHHILVVKKEDRKTRSLPPRPAGSVQVAHLPPPFQREVRDEHVLDPT